MKKVLIAFGSTTGNTERAAMLISDQLIACSVEVVNVSDVVYSQVQEADLVILGASTWGYGELQDDFADYFPQITAELYSGKDTAVFGCGDKAAFGDVFCEAVTLIERQLETCGANLVVEGLRIDGDVDANINHIVAFAQQLK